MTVDDNGLLNASNGGKYSKGEHGEKPKEGYDGQVSLAISGEFLDTKDGTKDVRTSTVIHELYENYLRTDKGIDYQSKSK